LEAIYAQPLMTSIGRRLQLHIVILIFKVARGDFRSRLGNS
jgi:hypothetical protein